MAALDTVMDPELDESVAAMGFIEAVAVEGRRADITFRLPTFWCSANFAFLMASDMRLAVEQLSSIDTARVRLVDHFASGKINRGVAEGRGFAEVFAGEASTDLAEIRRAFRERAFLGRQEKLLRALVARHGIEAALATTMAGLEALTRGRPDELQAGALRYLALRRHEAGGSDGAAPAFITLDGASIAPAAYGMHLRTLRRIKGAAEANAEMCRLYLEARISHPAPGCEPENRKDDDDD
ncbi:iron-sulfur cluster assembly protein [Lichenihabitans sp. Uapishka_5]|uniref:iron-sulfur cluster assembly protein n=1 Tax=Lichenihabitans sp. Uapishka_5 TaxID=3037302 RepID=UPI0029E7E410|nr:iron-sulfur cluster assembly protein [Lichenihabitans sp. Uapishka_5]MDX7950826.1 iron-sulfur cluster assembly protein [Lichenihabitans sp. Uapishka_5]